MKKILKTLFLAIIALSASVTLFSRKAEAITSVNIPLQVVEDLDNIPYPNTTAVVFDNDRLNLSRINVETAGQVKVIIQNNTETKQSGKVWISTDEKSDNILGSVSEFSENTTEVSWFLEKGTYFLNATCNNYPYNANFALLFEKAKVEEPDISTSYIDSIYIVPDKTFSNFLTFENPNEYYYFNVNEKSTVTINYSFDTSANPKNVTGYCSLYDNYELLLKEGSYSSTDKGSKSISYLLEPGKYYIKLNGMKGNTTLSIKPMYYNITLTPVTNNKWTKKEYKVNIDTSIEYSKIAVLCYDVKDSLLDSEALWSPTNKNYVALEGETFVAAKSGVYSVRITDKNGYNTMKKITISNVDVKKPTVYVVKNGKSYKKPITITWKDTQSGINKAKTTLNGKAVSSGVKVTKEGKYTLKVYDNVGNYRIIEFNVDFTAPVAGVENGKTYNDSITLKFRDNVSGIKKITLDEAEVSTSYTTMYIYTNGEYSLKLWDNAGNYREITFYIKK
jgi:hypothetical protein